MSVTVGLSIRYMTASGGRVSARAGGGRRRQACTWPSSGRARQGLRALVAEVIVGELARRAGLLVPEPVTVEVDPRLGAAEPDPEIQELITASEGANLGVDFLPGALSYTPAGGVDTDRGCRRGGVAGRTWHQRRSHGPPGQPAAVARAAVADRPRSSALAPTRGPGQRPSTRTGQFPMIAEHVLLRARGLGPRRGPTAASSAHRRIDRGGGGAGARRLVGRRRSDDLCAVPDPAAGRWRLRAGGRASPPGLSPFSYAILRVVPSVERGEPN